MKRFASPFTAAMALLVCTAAMAQEVGPNYQHLKFLDFLEGSWELKGAQLEAFRDLLKDSRTANPV